MITLKTMDKSSAQRVFNQVANHLLAQGKRAGSNRNCEYLTRSGLKCAAGCLIGKNEYRPEWEDQGWDSVAYDMGITEHSELVNDLQNLHDCTWPSRWRRKLIETAELFSLSTQWIK